jgi:outer membrane lipoprotein SlyB
MNNTTPPNKLHPLLAAAAGSVILASGVGIAAMTGAFNHDEKPAPAPVVATAAPLAPAPVATIPAPAPPVVATTPKPAKVVVKKEVVTHHVHHKAAAPKTVAYSESNQASEEHYVAPKPMCMDCGTVVAVQPVVTEAKPSGIGAVGGAILGGVLGHQMGGGDGKKAMTAVGVIGGAMAGNQIEKSRQKITSYDVTVQMEDGSTRNFSYDTAPSFSNGEHVKVSGGRLMSAY